MIVVFFVENFSVIRGMKAPEYIILIGNVHIHLTEIKYNLSSHKENTVSWRRAAHCVSLVWAQPSLHNLLYRLCTVTAMGGLLSSSHHPTVAPKNYWNKPWSFVSHLSLWSPQFIWFLQFAPLGKYDVSFCTETDWLMLLGEVVLVEWLIARIARSTELYSVWMLQQLVGLQKFRWGRNV